MKQHLLIVSGGSLIIPLIKKAVELGYYVHVTDGSASCQGALWLNSNGGSKIGMFHTCDTKNYIGHAKIARKLQKQYNLVGVCTAGSDVEFTVAYTAKACGLPSVNPHSAFLCNNKILAREIFNQTTGLETIRYVKVNEASIAHIDYDAVINEVGIPMIIKPVDNCASRGMTILYTKDIHAFNDALDLASDNNKLTHEILIEEFVKGIEYSVDTFIIDGKLYPAGISDRVFMDFEGVAVQKGSMTPSLLSTEVQIKMYKIMELAAKALEIDNSAFKGDLIIDNKGRIRIIEVTARTSGGYDSQYRKPLSFGIDMLKVVIDLAVGNKVDFRDLVSSTSKWSMTTTVFPKPGTVIDIIGLDAVASHANVFKLLTNLKKGDIIKPYSDCAGRVFHIIIFADTYNELLEVDKFIQTTLKVETQ